MDESKWKYFADPTKVDGRATKNFDTEAEANARRDADIAKWKIQKKPRPDGVVIEVKGKPSACNYCAAKDICLQREEYVEEGLL